MEGTRSSSPVIASNSGWNGWHNERDVGSSQEPNFIIVRVSRVVRVHVLLHNNMAFTKKSEPIKRPVSLKI